MSENKSFLPMSPELGIAGSSYRLQLGRVGEFWAIRLVKGKDVLDSKVWKEEKDMPNGNRLTGWVLSVLAIPNLNPYQIQKTVGFIRQKAIRNWEEQQRAKKEQGKSEREEVKLDKTPEKLMKRPKSQGWVKEEEIPLEDAQKAAEISPALAASNKTAVARTHTAGTIKDRKLNPIPVGEGYKGPTEDAAYKDQSKENKPPAAKSKEKSSDELKIKIKKQSTAESVSSDILSRLSILEKKVAVLEKENKELKDRISNLEK